MKLPYGMRTKQYDQFKKGLCPNEKKILDDRDKDIFAEKWFYMGQLAMQIELNFYRNENRRKGYEIALLKKRLSNQRAEIKKLKGKKNETGNSVVTY